jgi:uncharacterized protein YkwD
MLLDSKHMIAAAIVVAAMACFPSQANTYGKNTILGTCEGTRSLDPQKGCHGYTLVVAAGNFGPETLALINSYRVSRGLSPLAPHGALQALARQHSQYQAARNTLSHDGFRQRSARAKAAGLSVVCAENSGYNYKNAQQLFLGWRNSAAHRKNMLRPNLRYAGVSVVGAYATFFACQ